MKGALQKEGCFRSWDPQGSLGASGGRPPTSLLRSASQGPGAGLGDALRQVGGPLGAAHICRLRSGDGIASETRHGWQVNALSLRGASRSFVPSCLTQLHVHFVIIADVVFVTF